MAVCRGWWKASRHWGMTLEVPSDSESGDSRLHGAWAVGGACVTPTPTWMKLEAGPVLLPGWKAIPWPANASCFPSTVELEEAQGIWGLALNITPGSCGLCWTGQSNLHDMSALDELPLLGARDTLGSHPSWRKVHKVSTITLFPTPSIPRTLGKCPFDLWWSLTPAHTVYLRAT